MSIVESSHSSASVTRKAEPIVRIIFPNIVMRLAQTRRKNLQENRPPSGKILQGPYFKALDKPKLAVKRDVA